MVVGTSFVDSIEAEVLDVCTDKLVREVVVVLERVNDEVLAKKATLRLLAVSGDTSWYGFWKFVRQIFD